MNMKSDQTRFIDAEEIEGTRFCSNCNRHKYTHGGKYKISVNGKSQRWICKSCVEKRININKE